MEEKNCISTNYSGSLYINIVLMYEMTLVFIEQHELVKCSQSSDKLGVKLCSKPTCSEPMCTHGC